MAMQVLMKQTRQGDAGAVLSAGSTYTVTEELGAQLVGWGFATDVSMALQRDIDFDVTAKVNGVTGGIGILVDGKVVNVLPRTPILVGASAGANSGWLPISSAPERFVYQLASGSTVTTFSVDISADGITSLGQAFTGTWASSTVAEITFPIMFSNPLAKFFRWTVLSGGPLSVSRGV